MSEEHKLRPCPLCRHKAVLEVGSDYDKPNKIRCGYCGCTYGWPWSTTENDRAIDMLVRTWNRRAEYCQYCGNLVGAVEECPNCGGYLSYIT